MEIQSSTRRSFLKKTTALAVGISATSLFSGLVHAANLGYSGCSYTKTANGLILVGSVSRMNYTCYTTDTCAGSLVCGDQPTWDSKKLKYVDQPVTLKCAGTTYCF